LKTTGELLKNALFLDSLGDSLIRMPDLELLLSALRRVLLLEVPSQRFVDKALLNFTIALAKQCWTNEFVWALDSDEQAAAQKAASKVDAALNGDVEAGIEILRAALYIPPPSCIPDNVPLDRVRAIRPMAVRDFILPLIEKHRDEQARASKLAELAPVKDEVSLRVAAQYGAYPYPRWTSLNYLLRPGEWRKSMGRFFADDRLQFMDEPFEVLIAGCGTGVQAIAAARAYGPNARVTAIDISKPSLGYAARMAEHFGADNITFMCADIQDLAKSETFKSRFRVIESVGVLHHMADPFAGWRALSGALHPEGMMLIGLYSDIARQKWTAMHNDPAYPGTGCDDGALRRFRSDLMQRPDAELGGEFKGIRDIYCTSGFRDLMLHVSEKRHSIPEIGAFLNDNGLRFRGFVNVEDFERLQETHPDEQWPGTLAHWAEYEEAHAMTFAGMYRLWCDFDQSGERQS
jgi:2-polyprenyl-3-methyl-5-hydroxy-6-metoxy-1,4-benzoquinol methylase